MSLVPKLEIFSPLCHLFQHFYQMIADDRISGASMDLLGPLLFFLDRDVLSQVDREAMKLRLEDLKLYCMPSDTFREMASLLTERTMLG